MISPTLSGNSQRRHGTRQRRWHQDLPHARQHRSPLDLSPATRGEIDYKLDGFTITYIPAFIYYDFVYRTPLSAAVLTPALLPLAAAPYGGLLARAARWDLPRSALSRL